MADYIKEASLTDKKALPFKSSDPTMWASMLDDADSAVIDLAQELGLDESDIVTPLHTALNDYARYYFYARLFLEVSGNNSDEDYENDAYRAKGSIYEGKMNRKKMEITPEVVTKTVSDRGDRLQECILYHT